MIRSYEGHLDLMSIEKGGRQRLVLLARLEDPGQMINQRLDKPAMCWAKWGTILNRANGERNCPRQRWAVLANGEEHSSSVKKLPLPMAKARP